jgi:TRAP-type C4-dicarboxylate transport system permease small subunit
MTTTLLRFALRLPLWVAAGALMAMMLLTVADVVLRSTLSLPIRGSAEATEILLALMVFSALPLVGALNRHIAVDLVDPLLPEALLRLRDVAVCLVFGALLFWPAQMVWTMAGRAKGYGEETLYLGVPVYVIMLGIAVSLGVSGGLLVLRGVLLALRPAAVRALDSAGQG